MNVLRRCFPILVVLATLFTATSAPHLHALGDIPPVISAIESHDGYLIVHVRLGPGDRDDGGNWFYQVRTNDAGCANPYSNEGTWDTTTLVDSFRIGNRIDLDAPIDGYDLRIPLTNGCSYTIKVAHWDGSVGEYSTTSAIPSGLFFLSIEEIKLQELARQAGQKREAAQQTLISAESTQILTLQTLVDAGITWVIPEISEQVGSYIISLTPEKRKNINEINAQVFQLRRDYYLKSLEKKVDEETLVNLGFSGLTESMMDDLIAHLEGSSAVRERNFMEIQKNIDQVNVLVRVRLASRVSFSELSFLGVEITDPTMKNQILAQMSSPIPSMFQSISSIQQVIDQISATIQQRRTRTDVARKQTSEIRSKIASRNKS